MSFELTQRADQASQKVNITPQLVMEIEGVDTAYGILPIKKILRIGEFNIGDPGVLIGGQVLVLDQESLISFSGGTSTEIGQTLNVDKGTNESISSMKIALIDKGLEATRLITPGEIVTDILGRRVKVWVGFEDVSWKDDYFIVFRGVIDDVQAKSGVVVLNIASPDKKKQSTIFPKGSDALNGAIDDTVTTLTVDSTSQFLSPYTGPDATIDESLKLYVRIDDEIIRYEGVTATTFTSCTRGALGTIASAHDDDAAVDSFYVLEGNAIDLSLKLLLSGTNGPYVSDLEIDKFVTIDLDTSVPNAIFFQNTVFDQEYNPTVGDYITTTGATEAANNVTNKQIISVTQVETGWYLEIDDVSFVPESPTDAVMSIRSQYDVFGPNAGCALAGYEVDVREHLDIKSKYLSSANYKFYIKDTIDSAQEFISEQVYNPLSAFAIPRKAQSSVGIHQGPIPGVNIRTVDSSNVLNAASLVMKRSINKNFFNTIVYKFEEDELEERFKSGVVTIDGTSVTQIPVGNKALIIESKGLRVLNSAVNLAQQASFRRLRKYKFGAEYIEGLELNFKTGFSLEVGDKVIVDLESLKISDINTGTREGEPRLFEVVNKRFKINTGRIALDLVDTNFNLDVRYALIGPASKVKVGNSQSEFVLKPSYNTTRYGNSEFRKWENYIGAYVVVRSSDYSVSGFSFISGISGNTITLSGALGFTPLEDYIMELGDYDNQPANVKLVYGFMSDGANNFADGNQPYQMS